jgi:uncharacterized membrane protein YdbT with pleckstrin-like domain
MSKRVWLLPVVLTAILMLLAAAVATTGSDMRGTVMLIAIVGGLSTISGAIQYRMTELVLTTHRVSGTTGLLRRQSIDTPLSKIEGLNVRRDLLGGASVVVRGVGGSKTGFNYIANHREFRAAANDTIFARS